MSLEPSLLYFKQLTQRLIFQAQLTDWIPVGGTAEAGNIIEYGVGFSYFVYQTPKLAIAPVVELLGWTVLSGYESFFSPDASFATGNFNVPDDHGVYSAIGDTIINGKLGVWTYFASGEL